MATHVEVLAVANDKLIPEPAFTGVRRSAKLRPTIHLALVDDWEVRGNGTGHPSVLQFEPMRRITAIFDRHGVKGSFNVELMQQLAYRKHQDHDPQLREIADEWDDCVREAFRTGHDIQPHIHPQWTGANYLGDLRWNLSGEWSMLNYPAAEMRSMISAAVYYLENLLRPIDPSYKCLSYRSGSWCAAPSDHLFPILAEHGFVLDMSIVAGIRFDTSKIKLDYTVCEEDLLPYYPVMTDARYISDKPEPIVCIPTYAFREARRILLMRDARKACLKFKQLFVRRVGTLANRDRGVSLDEWANNKHFGLVGQIRKMAMRYTVQHLLISDLSGLDFSRMQAMLVDIRARALKTGLNTIPIILENHTKDVVDFSDIERFIELISKASDIRVVTLAEIARGVKAGAYTVLKEKRQELRNAQNGSADAHY